ncbi:hypothetical protein HYPSUDRAFT_152315, partial [Hypholoma sublateritium FD-334 SS-4]
MEDLITDIASGAQVLLCDACGRSFAQLNAYRNHIGSCRPQKKRMASALGAAKENYRNKKSRLSTTSTQLPLVASQQATIPVAVENTDSLSLAQRRPRRENRRPPLRYQHEQPAAPASLPLIVESLQPINTNLLPLLPIVKPVRSILESPSNIFGLFRQYFSTSFPDHDPDSEIQAAELSDAAVDHIEAAIGPTTSMFQPYPNRNAFLLGEWYWSNGVQKTKDGFQKLLNIISGDSFNPADVRNISWDSINQRLGESVDSEDMWQDEPDAGWVETSITLPIPFHRNTPNPGPQQYTFPPFRHRSIVSVL